MEIKDIQGNILFSVPITQNAVKVDELMKQHSISLQWNAITADEIPLGAYIEYNNIKYVLLAPYKPTQTDEASYEYKPEFQHPVMRWQSVLFFFYTYSENQIISKELDWSLTDNPANFMAAICDAIKNETGEDWQYAIASDLSASASLSFSNTDIFSALNSIANVFETEWWFDYENKILHLSKANHGDAVTLEVGVNIGVPSVNQNKNGYYTRYYVFGSTRNIDQNYSGSNVNSVINKRLTLDPEKYPNGYIDTKENLSDSEILSTTLVFDDIYPRSMLTISNVKVRLMWRLDSDNQKVQIGTDADGKPVYDQYAIWYFKIPGLSFNKDMVISGKALSVHFNDGPLQGREFELTYHDVAKDVETSDGTSIRVDAGDFEINFIEEGTYIIPAMTGLVPVDGNSVSLFNIVMPEEYKASAYEELEKAALKEIAKQGEDMRIYSFGSNAVEFFMSNPALKVGRKVTYKNGDYSYSTRVIKLETQLDRPYEQKITIGNEQIKGNTQTLKEEVVSANQNIDLISAINESTQQLMQSYQRTQKALLDSMSKWGNMWRLDAENNAVYTPLNMIVEGTLAMGSLGEGGSETPVAGLQKVSITIPNYDSPFVSDAAGNITLPAYPTALKNPYALKINGVTYDGSKEISINIEGGGGIADSVAWENVMGRPTALSEFENDMEFVSYATLNGYATQSWVNDNYLPLSGGTVKGVVAISGNNVANIPLNIVTPSMGNTGYIRFGAGFATNELGHLGFSAKGVPAMVYEGVANTLIHSGNIGSQSVNYAASAGNAQSLARSNGTIGATVASNGNVLIGTTEDNGSKLMIHSSVSSSARPTLGNLKGDIVTIGNAGYYGLHLWNEGTGNGLIQVGRSDGNATAYNLALQPLGGNVLIGTTDDNTAKLQVNGNMSLTSALTMKFYGNATCGLYPNSWITTDGVSSRLWLYNDNQLALYGSKIQLRNNTSVYGYLDVSGNIHANLAKVYWNSDSTNYYMSCRGTTVMTYNMYGGHSFCTAEGYERMRVAFNGDVAIHNNITVTGGATFGGDVAIHNNITVTGGATFGGDVKIGSSTLSWNTNGWLNINTNVVSDGTIGMFEITSSSDARLKDNIESVSTECSLAVVRKLRPTSWSWKKNSKKAYGLIAQEVSPIIPEAVDDLGDSLHLQYNQLHAFEIGAIQCIDSEVEKLKKDLKKVNEKIENLEQQLNEYRQWQ